MLKNENTISKNIQKGIVGLREEFDHLEKRMDGRILLIAEKINSLAKRVDERMDRFEESNRKNGVLLEKLDTKFDLSLEGYSSLKERTDKLEDRVSILEAHT
jgi:hypothetical protein